MSNKYVITEIDNEDSDELYVKHLARTTCWSDCPTEWASEVLQLLNTIEEEYGDTVIIDQVKEKYGDLMVYWSYNYEKYPDFVDHLDTIDQYIIETEVALCRKGVYGTLKGLYNSYTIRYVDNLPVTNYPYRAFISAEEVGDVSNEN